MSFIRVNEVGGDSLERVNKLLHNVPGGVYKAAFSALKRAGDPQPRPAPDSSPPPSTPSTRAISCATSIPRATSRAAQGA